MTINANALCRMKNGVCYYVKCKIFLQMNMQPFLYENLTNTLQANLMQVPCKMQQCIMMQKANVFVFFELKWDNKAKVWLYNPQTLQELVENTQAKH